MATCDRFPNPAKPIAGHWSGRYRAWRSCETRGEESDAYRVDSSQFRAINMLGPLAGRVKEARYRTMGQPEKIANAVAWLCSGQASFGTGAILPTDGGFSASEGYEEQSVSRCSTGTDVRLRRPLFGHVVRALCKAT